MFTRGLYKGKIYSNYAKEIFHYQAGIKKGMGDTMTHLVVIVKSGERNKRPDLGN